MNEFIGLFLALLQNGSNSNPARLVVYTCCLIDSRKQKVHVVRCQPDGREFVEGDSWGFPRFLRKQTLQMQAQTLLPRDRLTIAVDMCVFGEMTTSGNTAEKGIAPFDDSPDESPKDVPIKSETFVGRLDPNQQITTRPLTKTESSVQRQKKKETANKLAAQLLKQSVAVPDDFEKNDTPKVKTTINDESPKGKSNEKDETTQGQKSKEVTFGSSDGEFSPEKPNAKVDTQQNGSHIELMNRLHANQATNPSHEKTKINLNSKKANSSTHNISHNPNNYQANEKNQSAEMEFPLPNSPTPANESIKLMTNHTSPTIGMKTLFVGKGNDGRSLGSTSYIADRAPVAVRRTSWTSADTNLDLSDYLLNEKFADVLLISSDNRRLPAHRIILSCQSPLLGRLLDNSNETSTSIPKFSKSKTPTDVSSSAQTEMNRHSIQIQLPADELHEILRYLYSGRTDHLRLPADRLLPGADLLNLNRLKEWCEQQMLTNISITSVCDLLLLAERHAAPFLRARALEFVRKHSSQVLASECWARLTRSSPILASEILQQLIDQREVKIN